MIRIVFAAALIVAGAESASQGRIVGGREVSITKHPYLVSLRFKTCVTCTFQHACGGVIYNKNTIITAAHCVYKREMGSFVVVAGDNYRSGSNGYIVRVSSIVINPLYNPALSENDIAVIILATPLHLNNSTMSAIPLASMEPNEGANAIVAGWGATSEGGVNALRLQDVELNIIGRSKCNASYGYERIKDSMLCAGSNAGGKDACQYDSGGPLVSNKALVGIVSWGIGCARPEYPGVYANVVYFKDWIDSIAQS